MKWTFIFLGMFFMLNCHGADAKSSPQEKLWRDIHPYAFYPLIGGDYSLADMQKSVICVNISKLKTDNKSCELSYAKKVFHHDGWSNCAIEINNINYDSDPIIFGFKYYEKIAIPNYYVIQCMCGGGGGHLTQYVNLLIKRNWKYYYDSGEIKKIKVLTREGEFGVKLPSKEEMEKISNLIRTQKIGVTPKISVEGNDLLENVHPLAFYHLLRDAHLWKDKEKGIIGVNTTKLRINGHCNELSGYSIYRINGGIGAKIRDYETQEIKITVYFKVLKKLTTPGYYIVVCQGDTQGYSHSQNYFLIKKSGMNYYDSGKIKEIEVLTCEGDLGKSLPSSEEMAKIDQLVREKKIGDVETTSPKDQQP